MDRFRPVHRAILALAFLLPACGKGDKDAAPPPAPPIDGTATPAPPTDERPAAPPTPATLKHALSVINLTTFPVPDGAVRVQKSPIGSHYSLAKGDLTTAVEFYRAKLTELGWKPTPEANMTIVNQYGGQLIYVKQGFVLYAAIGVSPADGNLNAGLFHVGNIDARTLPKPDGVQVSNAMPQRVIYKTALKLDELRKFLRAEMKQRGWREFIHLIGGVSREDSSNDNELHFFNEAIKVDIVFDAKPDQTEVFCSVGLLQEQLPIPLDAVGIEFSDAPLNLHFYTKTELEPVLEFYRKELAGMGWKVREGAGKIAKSEVNLAFDAPDREPLRLECLRSKDAPVTIVRLTRWPKDSK